MAAAPRSIALVFGRFNPPTTGHNALIAFLQATAAKHGADARIYASTSHDPKSNPLSFADKVRFLKQLFPKVDVSTNGKIRTPFDAFAEVAAAGYRHIIVVVGSDRMDEFSRFAAYMKPKKSPGFRADKHLNIDKYDVVAVPAVRSAQSRGVAGMSASKLRGYATAGDEAKFIAGIPTNNTRLARDIYKKVRSAMGITEASMSQRSPLTETTYHTLWTVSQSLPVGPRRDYAMRYLEHLRATGQPMFEVAIPQELTPAQARSVRRKLFEAFQSASAQVDQMRSRVLGEATRVYTVVATSLKAAGAVRVLDSYPGVEHHEVSVAQEMLRKKYPLSVISVENQDGRVIDVVKPGEAFKKIKFPWVAEAAGMTAPKPPTEVDRMKTRQSQETISLKQRQNNEIMAAKMREIQQKAREQQQKTVSKTTSEATQVPLPKEPGIYKLVNAINYKWVFTVPKNSSQPVLARAFHKSGEPLSQQFEWPRALAAKEWRACQDEGYHYKAVNESNMHRKNDGYNSSPTPTVDDDVRIMGQVHGQGKKGYVSNVSPQGTHMTVKAYDGPTLGIYHASDLKVIN